MSKRWIIAVPVVFVLLVLWIMAIWPIPPARSRPPVFHPDGFWQTLGPFWSYNNCDYNYAARGYSSLLVGIDVYLDCSDGEADAIYASVGWKPGYYSDWPEFGVWSGAPDWRLVMFGLMTEDGAQPYLAIDLFHRYTPNLSWRGSPWCQSADYKTCQFDLREMRIAD